MSPVRVGWNLGACLELGLGRGWPPVGRLSVSQASIRRLASDLRPALVQPAASVAVSDGGYSWQEVRGSAWARRPAVQRERCI